MSSAVPHRNPKESQATLHRVQDGAFEDGDRVGRVGGAGGGRRKGKKKGPEIPPIESSRAFRKPSTRTCFRSILDLGEH